MLRKEECTPVSVILGRRQITAMCGAPDASSIIDMYLPLITLQLYRVASTQTRMRYTSLTMSPEVI
jgi:hypothetical protein